MTAGLIGLWIGLGLLKFGNPPIFSDQIPAPANFLQLLLDPWPLSWAYVVLTGVLISTIRQWKWPKDLPRWIIALPALWFVWQLVSALGTIDAGLTRRMLPHFAGVALAFYLGLAVLGGLRDIRLFWLSLVSAVVLVIVAGFYQHFIGLEETRRFFQIYELPKYPNGPPPELLKKLASNRIYSTLFYPNTLAAALLLGLPLAATKIYLFPYATRPARLVLLGVVGVGGLLCLFWTGSKAGWLIALIMVMVACFQLNFARRIKLLLLAAICLLGLGGFIWRYSSYLQKGATSVSARAEYWRAAARGFGEHPLLGSGPGTFMLTYKRLKPPQAEMARLAHNDYLQQACDSGVVGFAAFTAFIIASLVLLYQRCVSDPIRFGTWLSLLGLALHAFVEFNLYVPAVAWPQFLLFGWLWSQPRSKASLGSG